MLITVCLHSPGLQATAITLEGHLYHYLPFCELLIHRNVTFLKNLQKFHSQHLVIGYLVRHSVKNELRELSDILQL